MTGEMYGKFTGINCDFVRHHVCMFNWFTTFIFMRLFCIHNTLWTSLRSSGFLRLFYISTETYRYVPDFITLPIKIWIIKYIIAIGIQWWVTKIMKTSFRPVKNVSIAFDKDSQFVITHLLYIEKDKMHTVFSCHDYHLSLFKVKFRTLISYSFCMSSQSNWKLIEK